MKTSTKVYGTIAVALIAAGIATGCVAATNGLSDLGKPGAVSQNAKPAESPKPTPVVKAPLVGDLDGNGELSGWEKEQLAKANYTMPDGSQIAIPIDQPLPAPVIQAVETKLGPLGKTISAARGQGQADAVVALYSAMKEQESQLGRRIVPVTYGPARTGGRAWFVGSPAAPHSGGFPTQEAAIAYANEWINGSSSYVAMVFK